ncbi:acetylglutamate kinase [Microbacteriaceae bacterium 4G12]
MKDIIVVKCGGSILGRLSETFFLNLRQLQENYNLIVVHGGGPEIDEMLEKLAIPVEKKNGLRVTTKEVLEVVQMVLCGAVNKNLVAQFKKYGMDTIGLAGCDGMLLQAQALEEELGFVGDVHDVNTALLQSLLLQQFVPVISPIGMDETFQLYNINGDTAAAAIASHLRAKHLLFVTDVPGVLHNDSLLAQADEALLFQLMEEGVITGGMIPKVKAALSSLQGCVEQVVIVDGLNGFINDQGEIIGTTVTKGVSLS